MTKAWKWARTIVWQFLCLIIVSGVSVLFTLSVMRGPNATTTPTGGLSFSYSDFVAASLTAVTIVLAVIAAIIASIAFWTIKDIKASARKVALRQARSTVAKELQDLPTTIEARIATQLPDILEEQVKARLVDMAANGELAELFERASAGRLSMNPTADIELQAEFDPETEQEGER